MRIEHWLYTIPLRLRSLFRRDRVDRELEEELRGHIERQIEINQASGMNPEQARRAALVALGGLEQRKQQCRETRGVHWIGDLGRDLFYGLRTMRRQPGFTAAALLILALGIGANTAIFSIDNAMLFRVLPYKDPGRLVELFQKSLSDTFADTMQVAPANYLDWRADGKAFEAFAAWRISSFNLGGELGLVAGQNQEGGQGPERVLAANVSTNLFSVLGVEPKLGRVFQSGEDVPGKGSLAILSYTLWQRRFSASPSVLGKTIRANGQIYTVVGVMPQGFRFPIGWVSRDVEIWTPLTLSGAEQASRKDITLDVIARLRPGVKLQEAQASLDTVAGELARQFPETNKNWGVNMMPLADRGVKDFRGLFVLLSIAVGVVLLIACANVANLLLARGVERQKELTIRTAMGARSSRLVRQLITEGILLSFCGGLLGIACGYVGTRALASLAPTMVLPELEHVSLNAPVMLASVGLSILTGLLFSILPALTVSRLSPHGVLQETGRANTSTVRGNRLKTAMVIGEVALTLALLLCAGDILYSFYSYMSIEPGFDPHNVLTMRMALPKKKYANPQQWAAFFNRAIEEIRSIPGITSVAAGSGAPMEDEGAIMRFHAGGDQPTQAINDGSIAEYFRISPDYFAVNGMRLLRGRALEPADRDGFPRVAVINETLARKKFGNDDPIGKKVFLDGDVNESAEGETVGPPMEIVGVAHDTKQYGLFQITPQTIYVPMAQDPEQAMSLLVKTSGDAGGVVAEIRSRLARLDADQPVYSIRTLTEIFREEHAFFRFNTLLLAVFAAMALILSLTGIYAVMAYAVGQRAREFGIRLALGSPQRTILALVLRQGAWMSLIGIALGLALAWPATRMLARALKESMYLTLLPSGRILFPALCVCMGLTMLLACLLPARRATKADPMQALRCE